MRPNRKIALCLIMIVCLVLAQGGVLLAAGVGSDELVRQLRSDIDLILGASSAIMAALVVTIGILWRALQASRREFIETLKTLKDDS